MKGQSAPLAGWELGGTVSLFPMTLLLNPVALSRPQPSVAHSYLGVLPLMASAKRLGQGSSAVLLGSRVRARLRGMSPCLGIKGKGSGGWGRGEPRRGFAILRNAFL